MWLYISSCSRLLNLENFYCIYAKDSNIVGKLYSNGISSEEYLHTCKDDKEAAALVAKLAESKVNGVLVVTV